MANQDKAQSEAQAQPELVGRLKEAAAATAAAAAVAFKKEGTGAATDDEETGRSRIKTEGFGSEDLFGQGSKERTLADDAKATMKKVVEFLPEKVKQHIQAPEGEVTQKSEAGIKAASQLGIQQPSASSGAPATGMEREHENATVNRALEGKWVPTYMRAQLQKGGHTNLPSNMPNAHEHPSNEPPPSLGQAFSQMGQEVGESTQAMFAYIIAFFASLTLQCQMCSQSTASTIHEDFRGGFCCGQGNTTSRAEEDRLMGPLQDEATAGLGPLRSRLRRSMQGVGLQRVLEIVKTKLVCEAASADWVAPPNSFQRLVKARQLSRQVLSGSSEDWLFNSEVNPQCLPQEVSGHICGGVSKLMLRERWHIEHGEARAAVEISNDAADGPVALVLRMEITDRPDTPSGGCEVDSRLYAQPRSHGAVMPIGFMERLIYAHHMHSESLREIVLAFAEDAGHQPSNPLPGVAGGLSMAFPQIPPTGMPEVEKVSLGPPTAGADAEGPLPVVQWPVPEKR